MCEILPGAVKENLSLAARSALHRNRSLLATLVVIAVVAFLLPYVMRSCVMSSITEPPIEGSFGEARGTVDTKIDRRSDTVRDTITRYVPKYIPVATPSVLTDSRAVLDTTLIHADNAGDTLRVPLHVEYQRDSNRFENIVLPAFTVRREREVVNHYIDRTITVEIPKLVETRDTDDWWWYGAGVVTAVGGYFITKEAIRRLQ